MSFGIYVGGYLLVIVGLIYGAHLMHIHAQWIVVGTLVLVGMGVLTAVKNTRQKDPS